jgi:predicted permease
VSAADSRSPGGNRSGTASQKRLPAPPRLAEAILSQSLPPHRREEILGDMAETYARRVERTGSLGARLWYWRHAFGIPGRLAWRRTKGSISGNELRHATRSLLRSPGFVAVAVLSLALGIGANTAIFSIVRSVLFTPLAVDHPEELRLVYYERPKVRDISQYSSSQDIDPVSGAQINSNYSFPIYERMRAAAEPGVELLGFNFVPRIAVVIDGRPATSAAGMLASGDFFATLRPQVVSGRPFDEDDDRPDAPHVVVISYSFWQRAFGGDPATVGSVVRINGAPFEVVGVTGPGFNGLSPGGFFAPTDIIAPFAAQEAFAPRWRSDTGSMRTSDAIYWVRMIARLSAGASAAPLEEALSEPLRQAMLDSGVLEDPEQVDQAKVHFIDGSRGLDSLRQEVRRPLALLAGVVAAVLLIACVNLASLMLARGSARQHEIAVRRALGAGRLRLVRQLLLESLLLAAAGGVLGLLLAIWAGPALTAALTASLGRVALRFQIDWKLLLVVATVSLLAAVLSGVLPALRLTRRGAQDQLRTRAFGDGGGRLTLGRVLIGAQIAASIPLIVGAGLFLRTLGNLGAVDLGFNPDDLVIFRIDTTTVTEDPARSAAILEQVRRELSELPGVRGVTSIENALMMGWVSNTRVTIDGEPHGMYMNAVGPDFFDTMGIPVRAGRALRSTDDADAPRVVVINETAQRELFGGNALGRGFSIGDEHYEVVGVVADAHYESVRSEVVPTFYDPYQQRGMRAAFFLVRTPTPAAQLERSILDVVARADPGLPVDSLVSQTQQIAASTGRERIFARLLVLFGGFALLVASIGLYGVTSFAVSRRRPELGVRLALGARPAQILWLVLRSVLVVALVGLAVGALAARLVSPVVDSMVYGIEPTDIWTLLGAALVMLAVAVAAGWLPALRAARTDALIVLSRD